MTTVAAALLAAAGVVAVADWVAKARRSPVRRVLKPAVPVLLVGVALTVEPVVAAQVPFVVAGLVLGLAGDVALLRRGPRWLRIGALLFGLGHLAYLGGFAVRQAEPGGATLIAVLLVATAVIGRSLLPAVHREGGGRGVAVIVAYLVVLGSLLVGAVLAGGWLAVVGAALFWGSDLLLLHARFVGSVRAFDIVATAAYHLAQGALALSLVLG
ncbi:MAG: lysoplasmalogenase family protein [Egibacteraceae bacterium]